MEALDPTGVVPVANRPAPPPPPALIPDPPAPPPPTTRYSTLSLNEPGVVNVPELVKVWIVLLL